MVLKRYLLMKEF